MKIESTAFTERELLAFADELMDRERLGLAARLESAAQRLTEIGARVPQDSRPGEAGWTAAEVLAHIAVLSKFYGSMAYRVGSGKLDEVDLLGNVAMRDVAGAELAKRPPAELVAGATADQRRTAEYLRSADAAAMRRRAEMGNGFSMSAYEIALLPLATHLEMHLEQLDQALGQVS